MGFEGPDLSDNINKINIKVWIIKNDQYKGVYYYAAKAKRFDLTGEIVSNKYIETFVKERQFNTIFSFKLPIFLFFIGLMFLIYFCTKTTDKENLRIKPIHFLISIISSIVFSIIFLELIFNNGLLWYANVSNWRNSRKVNRYSI